MPGKNSLKIQQAEKYEGDGWWSWSVWLEGPKIELDKIRYAEYTLHPTFSTPVRRISTRKNNFKLSTGGWGVFPIYVRVVKKDETTLRLKHRLKLHYPTGEANKQ